MNLKFFVIVHEYFVLVHNLIWNWTRMILVCKTNGMKITTGKILKKNRVKKTGKFGLEKISRH